MTFGNSELAYAYKSVHLAGGLVAEQGRRLVITQRQVAVGARLVEVRLILERTCHRAQRKNFVVFIRVAEHEHAVAVMVPMAGDLIKVALGHKRSFCQQPAALFLLVLHEAFEQLDDPRALG